MSATLISTCVGVACWTSIRVANHTETLNLNARTTWGLPFIAAIATLFLPMNVWAIPFIALLLALSIIDLKTQMIPDWLTGLLISLGLTHSSFAPPALLGVCVCVAIGLLSAWITDDQGMIGSGDYFLVAVVIAWLGPLAAIDAILITLALFGLQLSLTQQRLAAFAPALSAGLALIWFTGQIA